MMSKLSLKNAVIAAVFIILFYVLGSRALDTGSYWEYLVAFTFFILSVKFAVYAVKKHGNKV